MDTRDPWSDPADMELDVDEVLLRRAPRDAATLARRGAYSLRVVAVSIVAIAVVGNVIVTYWNDDPSTSWPGGSRARFGYVLQSVAYSAGIAGVVFAASVAMAVWATVLRERAADREAGAGDAE